MRVALVAHDAGGANFLAALFRRNIERFEWVIVAEGPAAAIFNHAPSGHERLESSVDGLAARFATTRPDVVITGTGWQSLLERNGIQAARQLGIPVASVLDHWVNYRQRFGALESWRDCLPDQVLVGDAYALDLARAEGFPESVLGVVENPYLEEFSSEVSKIGRCRADDGQCHVLFLGEPLVVTFADEYRKDDQYPSDVAVQIVSMILSHPATRLVVRAHPSEDASRYDFLGSCADPSRVAFHAAADSPLEQDFSDADIVVGMSSMALLAAGAAGCRVIAYLPEGAGSGLPHAEIMLCRTPGEFMRALESAQNLIPPRIDLRLFTRTLPQVVEGLRSACS